MYNIRSLFDEVVQRYPNRMALQSNSEQLTYQQLHDRVLAVAGSLQQAGLTSHTIVALIFQNTPICVIGFLALAYLHTRVIPLASEATAQELEVICDDTGCMTVLGPVAHISRLRQAMVQSRLRFLDLAALLPASTAGSERPDIRHADIDETDDVFVYHYTSGSTGKPKAALHSQRNLINGGVIYTQTYDISPDDALLVPIPLYHSFGMVAGLIAALMNGARLVLHDRFAPTRVFRTLAEEHITVLIAVPLVYQLMARCDPAFRPHLPALRLCLSSGSPLSSDTGQLFFERFGQPIFQVYGSTETGVISAQSATGPECAPQSIGRPLAGVRVRIVDDDGRDLPPGSVGIALVQTSTMFAGYFNHPEHTARAFQNGWYLTGDLARQDEHGNLYLVGRKLTLITIGAKKVNPLEVEEVLLAHPQVREAVVFAADSSSDGQRVCAAVVVEGQVTKDSLIGFCRNRLAPFKVPDTISFLTELPRTSLGKLHRAIFTPEANMPGSGDYIR